jgi:hypothetical protein
MGKKPRNQEGQSPTRSLDERDERLRSKMKDQKGAANKKRTEAKIQRTQARGS